MPGHRTGAGVTKMNSSLFVDEFMVTREETGHFRRAFQSILGLKDSEREDFQVHSHTSGIDQGI